MDFNAIKTFIDKFQAMITEFYNLLKNFVDDMKNKEFKFTDNTVDFDGSKEG